MPNPNISALKNLGLDAFLFAEVGTELNGSALTLLSVLARLGQDPWAEAARWAKLPKAAVTDRLARSIAQMPLSQQELLDAPATASRLVLLLPEQTRTAGRSEIAAVPPSSQPERWVPTNVFYFFLILGMVLNMLLTPRNNVAPAAPIEPTQHTTTHGS